MLRAMGSLFIALGACLGILVGLAILTGFSVPGVSWVVAVGITKLALLASGGIMAAGAVFVRLDRRKRERDALPPPNARR